MSRAWTGRYCSAINCKTNQGSGKLSMFRFPKDPERCKRWQINTRRDDLMKKDIDYLYRNCSLCSSHFEDSQFMNVNEKKRLVWNAIPTLFDIPNPPKRIDSLNSDRKARAEKRASAVVVPVTPKKRRKKDIAGEYGVSEKPSDTNTESHVPEKSAEIEKNDGKSSEIAEKSSQIELVSHLPAISSSVPSNNVSVPSNFVSIPRNYVSVSSNDSMQSNYVSLIPNNVSISPNYVYIPRNFVSTAPTPSSNVLIQSNNVSISSNNVSTASIPSNNVSIPPSYLYIPRNFVSTASIPPSKVSTPSNNVSISSNNVSTASIPSNNVSIPPKNASIPPIQYPQQTLTALKLMENSERSRLNEYINKLRKTINSLRKKVGRLQKRNLALTEKQKELETIQDQDLDVHSIIKGASKYLPETTLNFFASQLRQAGRREGRRWNQEDIKFAFSIYDYSPSSYKFLSTIFMLPQPKSLKRRTNREKEESAPSLLTESNENVQEKIVENSFPLQLHNYANLSIGNGENLLMISNI